MKYRHHGYRDDDYRREREQQRPQRRGPRDISTREATVVIRCWQCGIHQQPESATSPLAACENCKADLHCCRTCMHFDPGARFECRKPIERAYRDKTTRNDCQLFEPRAVLDATGRRAAQATPARNGDTPPADAREAFENLFK